MRRRLGNDVSSSSDESFDDDDESGDDIFDRPHHIFFDIEPMLVEKRHVPNLLIASSEQESVDDVHVFRNRTLEDGRSYSCVDDFLDWLETLIEPTTSKILVLAHNFKGCDSYPIVDAYHRRCQQIQQLRTGGKVLQLDADKIRLIDSLSFFQMPLSNFPKTFGITELAKGQNRVHRPPQFLDSDKHDIRYVSLLTEERVEVHTKTKDEDIPVNP